MTDEEIYKRLSGLFDDVFEYEGAIGLETVAADVEGWDSVRVSLRAQGSGRPSKCRRAGGDDSPEDRIKARSWPPCRKTE